MIEIFVSYRRQDARDASWLLHRELEEQFGKEAIFFDRASLRAGDQWSAEIDKALNSTHVVLVLIGTDWATIEDETGRRRLDNPKDVVRREVETAIELKKHVLPILLGGATMPDQRSLPGDTLPRLSSYNALDLGGKDVPEQLKKICATILGMLPKSSTARARAEFHNDSTRQQFVVQYDLTGLEEARQNGEEEWPGGQAFQTIEPELINRARRFTEQCFDRLGITMPIHTPTGGLLCIPAVDHPERVRAEVMKAAKNATNTFYDAFLSRFAPHNAFGIHWPIDLRIAIAFGPVRQATGRNLDGMPVHIPTGSPINHAGNLLAAIDQRTGAPYVKRGAVCIYLRTAGLQLDGFKEVSWGSWKGLYVSYRPSRTETHIRIPGHVAEALKAQTLTADEKAKFLGQHTPPRTYPQIAALAKTGHRICFIVGAAGTGKTMLALRLVAELMYADDLRPNIPPIAPETWEQLNVAYDPRRVVFLDDAFGKTQLVNDSDFTLALEALVGSGGGAPATGQRPPFLRRDPAERPCLIITMRDYIWTDACKRIPRWEEHFGAYRAAVSEADYTQDQLFNIFNSYWCDNGGIIDPDYRPSVQRITARVTHPLSLADAAVENASGGQLARAVDRIIEEYSKPPLERYKQSLLDMPVEGRLVYFFVWLYGSGVQSLESMQRDYLQVAARVGDRHRATGQWEHVARQRRWGDWHTNGVFTPKHPLRTEALDECFTLPSQRAFAERVFEALRELAKDRTESARFGSLAAYAAARIPGTPGPFQKLAIKDALKESGGPAARSLASAAGITFRASLARSGDLRAVGDLSDILLVSVEGLLHDLYSPSYGVAFSALCDAYGSDPDGNLRLRPLETRALRAFRRVLDYTIVTQGRKVQSDQVRVQNLEHAIWAISSNYSRLPAAYRDALKQALNSKEEWIRLRTLEAIADYYDVIVEECNEQWAKEAVETSVNSDKTIAYRRGAMGAWEANFDSIDLVRERTLDYVDPDRGDVGIGFLEWSIWAAGEHFDYLRKRDPNLHILLQKLARHEDVRVRRWLATALAESKETRKRPHLRDLMTILARDLDEVVRGKAVAFFFDEDDEED